MTSLRQGEIESVRQLLLSVLSSNLHNAHILSLKLVFHRFAKEIEPFTYTNEGLFLFVSFKMHFQCRISRIHFVTFRAFVRFRIQVPRFAMTFEVLLSLISDAALNAGERLWRRFVTPEMRHEVPFTRDDFLSAYRTSEFFGRGCPLFGMVVDGRIVGILRKFFFVVILAF